MTSLFASVLRLDRKACRTLKIKDLYSLHRVVYSLFEDVRTPQDKERNKCSGIQWVDKGGNVLCRQILMLSDRIPKPCIDGNLGEVEYKPLPADFLSYKHYRFEVVVNPTSRDNETRKLIPIKGRTAIAKWFAERAQKQWGFAVNHDRLQIEQVLVQCFKKAGHNVVLQQVKVSGNFTVTDQPRFTQSVTYGIGRARAFGCGLLQIVPAPPITIDTQGDYK